MNFKELLSSSNIKNLIVYISIAGSSVFITKSCLYDKPIPVVTPAPVLEPTKEVIDINNKIHDVITQQVIKKEEQKEYVDSLTKVLKVKEKDLESVTKAASSVDTTFPSSTNIQYKLKDTIYSVHKKDDWIDISAYAGRDSGKILLSLRDTLTYTTLTRSNLFSTRRYVDIYHSNPYINTTSAYSLTFKEKQPLVIIGPYIGYGYDGKQFKPSIGVAVTVPLIKIK
jgi:hypothetical protein